MEPRACVSAFLERHYERHMDGAVGLGLRDVPPSQRQWHLAMADEIRRVYEAAGYDVDALPARTCPEVG